MTADTKNIFFLFKHLIKKFIDTIEDKTNAPTINFNCPLKLSKVIAQSCDFSLYLEKGNTVTFKIVKKYNWIKGCHQQYF